MKIFINLIDASRPGEELIEDIKKKVLKLSKEEKLDGKLGITFTDDINIKKYNKKYRKLNKATDVLSFSNDEYGLLGDIIISVETAMRNAKKYGATFKDEIVRLVVHGSLHIAGYDHIKAGDRIIMRKKEGKYIL